MNKMWININDQLPEELTPVIVWDPDYFEHSIGTAEIRIFDDGHAWVRNGEIQTFLDPKYWTYMLEGPK